MLLTCGSPWSCITRCNPYARGCYRCPSTAYRNYRASLARGDTLFFQAMRRKEPPAYCRRAVLVTMALSPLERAMPRGAVSPMACFVLLEIARQVPCHPACIYARDQVVWPNECQSCAETQHHARVASASHGAQVVTDCCAVGQFVIGYAGDASHAGTQSLGRLVSAQRHDTYDRSVRRVTASLPAFATCSCRSRTRPW
jgi:hypothetical protein